MENSSGFLLIILRLSNPIDLMRAEHRVRQMDLTKPFKAHLSPRSLEGIFQTVSHATDFTKCTNSKTNVNLKKSLNFCILINILTNFDS